MHHKARAVGREGVGGAAPPLDIFNKFAIFIGNFNKKLKFKEN